MGTSIVHDSKTHAAGPCSCPRCDTRPRLGEVAAVHDAEAELRREVRLATARIAGALQILRDGLAGELALGFAVSESARHVGVAWIKLYLLTLERKSGLAAGQTAA
jgi:hypothetical protein